MKTCCKGSLDADTLARFKQRALKAMPIPQAIDLRHRWANLRDAPLTFAEAEQALLVGHAFHPAPKSHEPFNETEARRYLPDFASRFPLRWFAVESELIAGESLNVSPARTSAALRGPERPELLRSFHRHPLAAADAPVAGGVPARSGLVPATGGEGALQDLGEAGAQWPPTSSPARCTAKPTAT